MIEKVALLVTTIALTIQDAPPPTKQPVHPPVVATAPAATMVTIPMWDLLSCQAAMKRINAETTSVRDLGTGKVAVRRSAECMPTTADLLSEESLEQAVKK